MSNNEYACNLLRLIFSATPYANVADNASSSPLTSLYVSLHTATPTSAGTQSSSEAAYTGYARVAVARTTGGWTVTNNSVSPVSNITFASATSGSETETFFGVGSASGGAGHLLYFGGISPTIAVSSGVQPILASASAITET